MVNSTYNLSLRNAQNENGHRRDEPRLEMQNNCFELEGAMESVASISEAPVLFNVQRAQNVADFVCFAFMVIFAASVAIYFVLTLKR